MGFFEIDDIFNNTLGSLIGYSLVNIIFIIKDKEITKKFSKVLLNCVPLVITVVTFCTIFAIYNLKEFGYLSISATSKINMKNVEIINNVEALDNNNQLAMVYQAHLFTEEEEIELASTIFKNLGSELDLNDDVNFDNFATNFRSIDNHILTIDYIGGTYRLSQDTFDYSIPSNSSNSNSSQVVEATVTERDNDSIQNIETILSKLDEIGINLDYDYTYKIDENGNFTFTVGMYDTENGVIDGTLQCYFDENGSYRIINNLIEYTDVRECEIISMQEAYEQLINGHFSTSYFNDDFEKIEINSIELDYMLDSKNFYQPVYTFSANINDEYYIDIYIPALV